MRIRVKQTNKLECISYINYFKWLLACIEYEEMFFMLPVGSNQGIYAFVDLGLISNALL